MISRKSVVRTIGYIVTLTCILAGGSFSWFWHYSQPLEEGVVQGASTYVKQESGLPNFVPYPDPILKMPLSIRAQEYALLHLESGKLIAQSSTMPAVPIASTTKLMTAYLANKNLPLDMVVTISPTAASQIGSLMGLYPNEKITVRNLIYGMMLVSGNDAAYALAETVGSQLKSGSSTPPIDRFVELMNTTARQLGLNQTHYKDPAGLNDEGRSTAIDLARLLSNDLSQPFLKQTMSTSNLTVYSENGRYSHQLHNSNRLIADMPYAGIIGGKTGNTPEAGHCLTTAAARNGKTLITVVLHTTDDTNDASAIEARKLLDIGFSQTTWR